MQHFAKYRITYDILKMDANLLDMSIEFFEFYQEIMDRTILVLSNNEPVGKGKLHQALRCNSQLKNIVIFLKLARDLSLKIDTQTVNRIAGDTELWVNRFKKIVVNQSSKAYRR